MSVAIDLLGKANWLWPNHRLYDLYNVFAKFRGDYDLPSIPESVTLYLTADQGYRLWINGQYITRGPARGFQESWPYDEVEIGPYLCAGANRICAEVYNPGHGTYQYISKDSGGFICAAMVGDQLVATDETWLSTMESSRIRDTALYSRQLFHQEHIDARLYDRQWINSPELPADWHKPELTVFGSMPWHTLEPRGTLQLREIRRKPLRTISSTEARESGDCLSWRNVTEGLAGALKGAKWEGRAAGSARDEGPYSIPAAGKGRFRAIILDFGETVVGPCSVSVEGSGAGEILDLFFFEMTKDGIEPTIPFPAFCEASMSNRLILKDGTSSCDFFHMLGFRYALVAIHESTSEIYLNLSVWDTGYPYEDTGTFECSDEKLNAIWQICKRTEQVCSLDSYVDTPWREQAQWWGDSGVQFRNSLVMDWAPQLMARGLKSIIRQRAPNGLTYGMAPTMAHICILPDYTLSWPIFCFEYYARTGDLSVFAEHLEEVEDIFRYFDTEAPRIRGLLASDRRYWLFLDWAPLPKEGAPTLYNMWYLYSLRMTAKLFAAAKLRGKALVFEVKAKSMEAQIESLCFDEAEGLYHDGFDREGAPLNSHSVHVQTMAIILGLSSCHHESMLKRRILPFLRGEKLDEPLPSAYWSSYVISVARMKGYSTIALDFIRRRWTPMIEHGTTFEVFSPEEKITGSKGDESMNASWGNFSASHAWSAHPMHHLSGILGGIEETEAGPDIVRFDPCFPDGIHYLESVVPHPKGRICSSWREEPDGIRIRLSLPDGVKAEVSIPGFKGVVEGERVWLIPKSELEQLPQSRGGPRD
jgi:hypothetical protein